MGLLSPSKRPAGAGGASDAAHAKFEALERNWRRVASTHTLQARGGGRDSPRQLSGGER